MPGERNVQAWWRDTGERFNYTGSYSDPDLRLTSISEERSSKEVSFLL